MELFVIQCTTCRARLKVHEEGAIGQILDCPKCGSFVQVVPPPGWKRPAGLSPASDSPDVSPSIKTGVASGIPRQPRGGEASVRNAASGGVGGAASRSAASKSAARSSEMPAIQAPPLATSPASDVKPAPPPLPPKSASNVVRSAAPAARSTNRGAPPGPVGAGSPSARAPTPNDSISIAALVGATASDADAALDVRASGRQNPWLGDWRVLSAGAAAGVLLAIGSWLVVAMLLAKPAAVAQTAAKDHTPAKDPTLAKGAAGEARNPPAIVDSPSKGASAPADPLKGSPSGAASQSGSSSQAKAAPGGNDDSLPARRRASPFAVAPAPASDPAALQAADPEPPSPAAASDSVASAPPPAPTSTPGKNGRASGPPTKMSEAAKGPPLDPAAGGPDDNVFADSIRAISKKSDPASVPSDGEAPVDAGAEGIDSTARAAIEMHLADRLPAIDFPKATLREFIDFVSEFSTLSIVLDRPALAKVGKDSQTTISVRLKNVSVSKALEAALGRHGLVAVVRGDKVVVTTAPGKR